MFIPDLINPLDALFGKLRHGPLFRISYERDAGYTGAQVEYMLRQYGIRVWGREVDHADEIAIQVKRSQALWAEYILCRAGIPLTYELLDPRNADYYNQHTSRTMPTPWTEKGIGPHSFVDHVVDLLVKLIS